VRYRGGEPDTLREIICPSIGYITVAARHLLINEFSLDSRKNVTPVVRYFTCTASCSFSSYAKCF